jgi:putative acetyltransferase
MDDVTIRAEEPADAAAIGAVVAAAFGDPRIATLVEDIRATDDFVPAWSLVAVAPPPRAEVVGHVMVSWARLVDEVEAGTEGTVRRVASLSPLGVAPDRHGRGIGGALVRAVVARVDAAGEPLVVVEGDPRYYGRFGFEPSAPQGIHIALPDWAPPEAAQVLRLAAYDPAYRGRVRYPPAFDGIE